MKQSSERFRVFAFFLGFNSVFDSDWREGFLINLNSIHFPSLSNSTWGFLWLATTILYNFCNYILFLAQYEDDAAY